MALQHLRSSTASKRPTPAAMSDGQLALNTNDGSPGLFFKDSNGGLVKVGPVHVGTTAPNASPASGGATGNTKGEQWLDTSGTNPVFKIWDGSAWQSEAGEFVNASGDVMTGALGIIAGSAGSPGLYFSGDTNTGIYSPGADQVAISTNSTGRLFINSSGSVGIGANSPVQPLEVVTATGGGIALRPSAGNATQGLLWYDTASGPWGFVKYDHQASALSFGTVNSERMRLDSSGRLGLGTSVPSYALSIKGGNAASQNLLLTWDTDQTNAYARIRSQFAEGNTSCASEIRFHQRQAQQDGGYQTFWTTNSAGTLVEAMRIDSSQRVGIGSSSPSTKLEVSDGSITAGSSGDVLIGRNSSAYPSSGAGYFKLATNNVDVSNGGLSIFTLASGSFQERLRITSAGNVGIGTANPSLGLLQVSGSNGVTLAIKNTTPTTTGNEFCQLTFNSTDNGVGNNFESAKIKAISANGGTNSAHLTFENSGTERARIDSSGRLLVGTSSSSYPALLQVSGNTTNSAGHGILQLRRGNNATTAGDDLGAIWFGDGLGGNRATIEAMADAAGGTNDLPSRLVFSTTADGASSPTERMRIHSNGDVGIGLTGQYPGDNNTTNGVYFEGNGKGFFSRSAAVPLLVNRNTDDGTLAEFRQAGTLEGTISVSGTTVSYNGAHLSRWSQLPSGAERTEILRGSVLSNIDEMCEWGDEDNEQLNRMKVSDVEGDKNVSGVFQAWDDDDDTYTNDFYCAMTGDFIIRIGAGVTVERGDLLMSAGDGTAKPQDDDIIRSKTIAKVTSTNVTCTYDDGSYCVPCVLMAC